MGKKLFGRRFWLRAMLVLSVLLAVFEFGRYWAGFDRVRVWEDQKSLEKRLGKEVEQNIALRAKLAGVERSSQIDQGAYAEIKTDLLRLQEENQDLREKLSLYRAIVSPEEGGGLRLQSVKLMPRGDSDLVQYQVLLAQAEKTGEHTRGHLRIWVDAWLDGALKRLTLAEVSIPVVEKLSFDFMYFQTIEGDLRLPKGYKPIKLVIKAVPDGGEHLVVEGSYPWPDASQAPVQ